MQIGWLLWKHIKSVSSSEKMLSGSDEEQVAVITIVQSIRCAFHLHHKPALKYEKDKSLWSLHSVWTRKFRKSKRNRHYSIKSIDHFHSASESKNSPLQRKIGGSLDLLSVPHMLSLLQSEQSVLHVRFIHKTRGAVAVWKASLRLFISFTASCDCGEFLKISFSLLGAFVSHSIIFNWYK